MTLMSQAAYLLIRTTKGVQVEYQQQANPQMEMAISKIPFSLFLPDHKSTHVYLWLCLKSELGYREGEEYVLFL